MSSGDVKLTDLGRKFLKSDINERRDILREQLQQIEPFNSLMAMNTNPINMTRMLSRRTGVNHVE